MTHVVYLLASALVPRDPERLGMLAMRERGWKVTVLDLADLCHPTIKQNRAWQEQMGESAPVVVKDLDSLADQEKVLATADVIFCILSDGLLNRHIYPIMKAVSRSGRPYGLIRSDSHPGVRNYKGEITALHKRIRDIYRRRNIIDPVTSLMARLPLKALGIRPADFVIVGGTECARPTQLVGPSTLPILAHSFDYESFLRDRQSPVETTDTAVFIDAYVPHHRDWGLFKIKSVVDPDAYYAALRRLFDRIEGELGIEVVIAAHPRADYSDKPGVFGDRRIEYGKTNLLLRQCRLALNFTSLAMNFAIFYRKPLLLLSMQDHYNSPAGQRYTDPISRELGLPVLFLEDLEQFDLQRAISIDERLYDRYIQTYVKQRGSPERPYWDIVIDALEANGLLPSRVMAAE